MDDKKIFDVTPPKTPESIAAAKNARKIMLNDPQLKQDTSATPDMEQTTEKAIKVETPHVELNLSPLTKEANAGTAPEVEKSTAKPIEAQEAKESIEPANETIAAPEPVEEPSLSVTEQEDADAVEKIDEPTESEEEQSEVEELSPPQSVTEEKDEPIKESAAVDSILPDDSQRATATAKDAMQSPTMYDTKAYYVPIGNSQHRHGHVIGALIAGLLTAAVVVGAVFAVAKFL
jgi:hypothetical protein